MSAEQEAKSLGERVEVPGLSKDAAKKIAHLEQEFIRAEVEQCMPFPYWRNNITISMYM